jgi:Ser/Thr protein kinase RdoA (MazF antagonist)
MPSGVANMQPPPFPVTSSVPSVQSLVSDILIPAYGLAPSTTCRFLHRGLNDTFLVESDSTKFILRVYRVGWRSGADIAYELDVLDHLAAKGMLVSTAIRRQDVGRITTIAMPEGDRPAVLFTFAPGEEVKEDGTDSVDFGRSCAAIHAASDDFASRHERFELDLAHLLDEPIAHIRPHLAYRAKDWDFVQTLADRLRQLVSAIDPSTLDIGFCHGDFHGGNAHREGDLFTHFDFDCCGRGSRAYDIAVYRWAARLRGKESETKRWPPFFSGYRETRKLSAADLSAVNLFVPIRQIWLMGMHLQGGPRWGFGWMGNGYFNRNMKLLREMATECLDKPPLFAEAE